MGKLQEFIPEKTDSNEEQAAFFLFQCQIKQHLKQPGG